MKKIIGIMCLAGLVFTAPVTVAFDQDEIDCCIKPCSCLPAEKRKPTCSKKTRGECKRLGGEEVVDCILCQ